MVIMQQFLRRSSSFQKLVNLVVLFNLRCILWTKIFKSLLLLYFFKFLFLFVCILHRVFEWIVVFIFLFRILSCLLLSYWAFVIFRLWQILHFSSTVSIFVFVAVWEQALSFVRTCWFFTYERIIYSCVEWWIVHFLSTFLICNKIY